MKPIEGESIPENGGSAGVRRQPRASHRFRPARLDGSAGLRHSRMQATAAPHMTNNPTAAHHPPAEILDGLRTMGLLPAGVMPDGEPLAGGVSSDIWRVVLPGRGPVCV